MTTRPHHITARDWARMSWHQQSRAHRAWVKALEAERCPVRVEPVVAGPYSRLDARDAAELAKAALARIIATLAAELDAAHEANLLPHGTEAAYVRHQRAGEPPCDACHALHPARTLTSGEVDKIRALTSEGRSTRAVAAAIGRSTWAVRHHRGDAA